MRPKKPILLYCADRNLLAVTAFALRLYPYEVAAVCDGKETLELTRDRDATFECGILIHTQQTDLAGLLDHQLLEGQSQLPHLLVDRVGDLATVRYADMVLYGRNTTMAHVLAALRVLCHGKPGLSTRRTA